MKIRATYPDQNHVLPLKYMPDILITPKPITVVPVCMTCSFDVYLMKFGNTFSKVNILKIFCVFSLDLVIPPSIDLTQVGSLHSISLVSEKTVSYRAKRVTSTAILHTNSHPTE